MSTRLADYDYKLPEELIADRPAARREDARLLLVDRSTRSLSHHRFHDFERLRPPAALTVLNNTRVIPARVFDTTRNIEALLLDQTTDDSWRALVKPGRKMRVGDTARLAGSTATVTAIEPDGTRHLRFEHPPDLDTHGVMPLPPYIRRPSDDDDRHRYQTVFASKDGAVAAPTAGLHFTNDILSRVPHTFLTLHVGAGTFKPVQSEDVGGHRMHSEEYAIGPGAARAINGAQSILAVGTTVVRVLEAVTRDHGGVRPTESRTDIFIRPPHRFRAVDHLLTNFHLPRSTLLLLVAAFAGREFILEAYAEAVRERYRFFSYGDCMLIL